MKFKVTDAQDKVFYYDLDDFINMLNNQFDLMEFEVEE